MCVNVNCVQMLTSENIRHGHNWCDRCSGREAVNARWAEAKLLGSGRTLAFAITGGMPEQTEMFEHYAKALNTSRKKHLTRGLGMEVREI